MAILVSRRSRVITQGTNGEAGLSHTGVCRRYGPSAGDGTRRRRVPAALGRNAGPGSGFRLGPVGGDRPGRAEFVTPGNVLTVTRLPRVPQLWQSWQSLKH